MPQDARFEDGAEKPLRLRALAVEDLPVIATLTQDAVFPASEMNWQKSKRRFAVLLNRFRWEDVEAAKSQQRDVERVQSVLAIEDVVAVASQGVPRGDQDTVLSLLSIEFEPQDGVSGSILLTFAGDGAVRVTVEALEMTLTDVTKPYAAPSRMTPKHED